MSLPDNPLNDFPLASERRPHGYLISEAAIARHHARKAYEEARADWRTAADNQQYQGRSAALMGSAHAVYRQADRRLAEAIEQMLADCRRLSERAPQ